MRENRLIAPIIFYVRLISANYAIISDIIASL
jgi:hypothetical protein